MRLANREEIATLIFQGVTNRAIIGQEQDGRWSMYYLAANGFEIAHGQGRSREEIIEGTKRFMCGHGKQIIENLIQDSEIYLGSMNLQPTNND